MMVLPALVCVAFALVKLPRLIPQHERLRLRELWRDRYFQAALLAIFLAGATEVSVAQWLPAYAETGLGFSRWTGGMALLAFSVAMAAGLWCLRRLEWKRPALAIVLLAASAGLAAMPYFLAIGGLSKKKKLAELMGLSFCGTDGSVMLASMPVGKGLEVVFKFTSPFIESMHTIFATMLFVWVAAMVLKRLRPSLASLQAQGPERLAGVAMMLYLGVMLVVLEGLYRVHHYLDYRHTMMVAMVISPLAGQGVLVLAGALARARLWLFGKSPGGDDSHRYARWMKFVAVTGSLALAAGIVGHNLWEPLHYGKGVYRQAMAELAQTPGGAVLSDSPWVDHYLWQASPTREAKIFYSWPASAGEIHKLAIASGVRYVVLPAQRKSRLVPSSELMVREGFRPWKEYVATNGDLLRVYEAPGRGASD